MTKQMKITIESDFVSVSAPKMSESMPEGYYSGDKPNPNLRAFVEEHLKERPYDPEHDDYNVLAFDKPINTKKVSAIYNMHNYWSKKPHDAIRQYINHYTKPGDLVLDPFCGSGGTALAALMGGRKAIAIDRSPAATFITKNYCTPVDARKLRNIFDEIKRTIESKIDWLYETHCDRCGGKAMIEYTVYSQVFQCSRCMEKVALFDCVEMEGRTAKGKSKKIRVCPYCYKKGHHEVIRSQSEKFGAVPVLVNYICQNGCKPAREERRYCDSNQKKREYFEKYDLAKLQEIEDKGIPYWYPQGYDMTGFSRYQRDALRLYGVKEVADLFTKRNLWALAAIADTASKNPGFKDSVMFSLTAILFGSSKMYLWTEDGQHGFISGTYYLPQISREINVINQFSDKFESLQKMEKCQIVSPKILISTDSVTNLEIPSNSIDYIFTDPPYAGKFQYGELNFTWESWLRFETNWHGEEITVNELRGKTEADWAELMKKAMAECYRVLKPGRWISLCYHDTSEGTWALIQDIMAVVGFISDRLESALFIDSIKKTFNQYTADKVNKRDLVINFRKPKHNEITSQIAITGDEDESTFNEKVRKIIRDYLDIFPGSTKDRIYDELVSRMVRAGKMEAHNFDELLVQVAETVGTANEEKRWYLKESAMSVMDDAESAKEDNAAAKIQAFIVDQLKKNPSNEGVHYSDIFELYIYALKEVKDKPRRPLAEWLLDYFFKTESGTYRLPISKEEEKLKADGRSRGINRQIKRYIAYLEHSVPIPEHERPNDATLMEWIRHCKRSGMFIEGKLLYEKGGINLENLSDENMVNVDEDYQICVRMLARKIESKIAKDRKQSELTE